MIYGLTKNKGSRSGCDVSQCVILVNYVMYMHYHWVIHPVELGRSTDAKLKSIDFSFIRDMLSFGILRNVEWQFHTDVSGPEVCRYNFHRGGSQKSNLMSFNDTVSNTLSSLQGQDNFPFSKASHIGSGAYLASYSVGNESFSPRWNGQGVKLNTYHYLNLLPHKILWCVQGQIYLCSLDCTGYGLRWRWQTYFRRWRGKGLGRNNLFWRLLGKTG